jgi:glycosyltransferase involved in cell wall biosynthesis
MFEMNIGARVTVGMISMNEAQSIEKVIKAIQQAIPEAEILLVDSSNDDTPLIARQLGARVIRQYPPQGYGPAMMRLLKEGSREVIVTLDCDNTYPAEKIPELAAMIIHDQFDVVDASRLQGKPHAMPWANYLVNWGFAWLASLLFQRHLTDLHSGMRAYRKSMLQQLQFAEYGAALPVELLLKPIMHHFRVQSVYIDYQERIGQSKMRPWSTVWWTFKRMISIRLGN